jgi:hypothetical protein
LAGRLVCELDTACKSARGSGIKNKWGTVVSHRDGMRQSLGSFCKRLRLLPSSGASHLGGFGIKFVEVYVKVFN